LVTFGFVSLRDRGEQPPPAAAVQRKLPILVGVGAEHWFSVFQYDAV
jgi:hypothetical protein